MGIYENKNNRSSKELKLESPPNSSLNTTTDTEEQPDNTNDNDFDTDFSDDISEIADDFIPTMHSQPNISSTKFIQKQKRVNLNEKHQNTSLLNDNVNDNMNTKLNESYQTELTEDPPDENVNESKDEDTPAFLLEGHFTKKDDDKKSFNYEQFLNQTDKPSWQYNTKSESVVDPNKNQRPGNKKF